MERFRKKPVVIEAMRWTGDNTPDIVRWVDPQLAPYALPKGWWLKQDAKSRDFKLMVPTLEGEHQAAVGDWIIKGVAGEYYPCKPEIFAQTYEPDTGIGLYFSFGDALAAMKHGAAVARKGWNGKGMWIALTPGSAFEARHAKCGHAAAKRAVELGDGEAEIELLPHIDMRAADGSIVVGWLASQTDMLAEDWHIVEPRP